MEIEKFYNLTTIISSIFHEDIIYSYITLYNKLFAKILQCRVLFNLDKLHGKDDVLQMTPNGAKGSSTEDTHKVSSCFFSRFFKASE